MANANGGLKTFGTVLAMAAVVAAIIQSQGTAASQQNELMSQRVNELGRRLESVEIHAASEGHPHSVVSGINNLQNELDRHVDTNGHPASIAEIERIKVQFAEVETQFRELRGIMSIYDGQHEKRLDRSQAWREAHDLRVRGLNAAQWERIKALERSVYGKPQE